MPKEANPKNLFFKKAFTTHLGGGSPNLDQDPPKAKDTNNNHDVDSSNGDSEGDSVGRTDTDSLVDDVVESQPETPEQPDEVANAVSDSLQNKPGKRPIRGKRPDEGLRSQGSRTPREQKLNRPNKDGGRSKAYGRSGPMSSHQYRGPGHHHNRPHHPAHAQVYPGHPMPGMFAGPPVHPQQYVSEHLSQSPLESGFIMPIHSPRRTPRHSESSSCGSPVFGGMSYQGPNQSPYHSPPPTSPRMSNYYESPPVQVPIMHHPRFPHHMSPYNSPPNAPSPLNYPSRGEAHAQGMVPQQRTYPQQEMIPTVHQMMVPGRGPNQVPISQNMAQMEPEYLMQVSHPGQMRSQHTPPDQQMMMQQQMTMWQMQQREQQRNNALQQSMLQQQDQQSQIQQSQMMAQQQMLAQQLSNMQQMFTPEQMQHMLHYMQQQQMAGQLLLQQQQKQLPQNHLQQVQANMLMNTPMGQMMPGQEMMQFPNAAMAQFTRPPNQPHPQFQGIQNMQQQLSLLNIAGQQQGPIAFSQANRNPQFMGPRFPPPMPPSISTENLSRSTPDDPAIITTIAADPSMFGGPGSAFVDHTTSEPSKIPPLPPPPIPKPDIPLPPELPLDDGKEIETPVPKPLSTDPLANIIEAPKKNTPGIIHLPPTLPTEEEMMKSPDSTSGTPISMKKNYWQMRKKSSDESPTSNLTKNLVAEAANMKDVTVIEKEEVEKISPPIEVPLEEKTPTPVVTPKKSAQVQKAGKDPKPFYLSDFSALVSDTVTHNNKLPKTSIPSSIGNVEVIPSESMIRSVKNRRGQVEHKETHWRAHDIREKRDDERWRPASRESREKDVETSTASNWRDKPKDPKEEDERRASLLKEAESKGMSAGEQIAYTLKKLEGKSPKPKRSSESSVVDDNQLEGVPNWYDDDEDDLDPFDLNI